MVDLVDPGDCVESGMRSAILTRLWLRARTPIFRGTSKERSLYRLYCAVFFALEQNFGGQIRV